MSATTPIEIPQHLNSDPADSAKLLFVTYGLMLAIGIGHFLILQLTLGHEPNWSSAVRSRVFTQIAVVECLDILIIAAAFALRAAPIRRPNPGKRVRVLAWLAFVPVLGLLIGVNMGYHWLLRNIFHLPLLSDHLLSKADVIAFITICVQPALFEEAYFRAFALDCLDSLAGVATAIGISATMFGFAHVALLASVPYLIFVGVVFACLRLKSGTVWLPILMHFAHNLIILLINIR
jgi:membrane protease YdiL (CAAX protease family)